MAIQPCYGEGDSWNLPSKDRQSVASSLTLSVLTVLEMVLTVWEDKPEQSQGTHLQHRHRYRHYPQLNFKSQRKNISKNTWKRLI